MHFLAHCDSRAGRPRATDFGAAFVSFGAHPEIGAGLADKAYYVADFCWPSRKVIVEYDSDLHTGSEKIAQDTMRRNFLSASGCTVVGIARIQSNSESERDRVMSEIKRALGMRADIRCRSYFEQKRAQLGLDGSLMGHFGRKTLANSRFCHEKGRKTNKDPAGATRGALIF